MEPLDHYPGRDDFERGCMPDGSLLRFASRALYASWGAPLPGKSNVIKKARKQDVPPDCGSILTPDEGEFPHTGVPCPVPEQGDEGLNAAVERAEDELDVVAFNQINENRRLHARLTAMAHRAMDVIDEHPELLLEDLKEQAPREASEPGEREPHEEIDAKKSVEQAQASADYVDEMLEKSAQESGWAHQGPEPKASAEAESSENKVDFTEPKSSSPANPAHSDTSSRAEKGSGTGTARSQTPFPATFRIPSKYRGGIYGRLMGIINLAARLTPSGDKITLEWRELGYKMLARGKKNDLKNAFLENRAVAVVKNTLLHCDETFRDLGFGGWMPFRYADQWLAFSSLMRKLLAANGLITPKGPNHWRDFIENTPEVEEDKLRLPKSLGPTKKYAAVESIEEVIKQATEATKKDPAAKRRFDQRFAMGP